MSGRVLLDKTHHQVAYCAQNPCELFGSSPQSGLTDATPGLEHATIRNSIIFGSSYGYDEARYQAVVEACALARDLDVFEAGDLTGETGPGLRLTEASHVR